jgi:hypothetical protein
MKKKKKERLLTSHLVIQSEILPKNNIIGPKGCQLDFQIDGYHFSRWGQCKGQEFTY